jgi:hypothetical protein
MCYSAKIQTLFAKPQPETVYNLKSFVSNITTHEGHKVRRTVACYASGRGDVVRRVYISALYSPLASLYNMIPQRITTTNTKPFGA